MTYKPRLGRTTLYVFAALISTAIIVFYLMSMENEPQVMQWTPAEAVYVSEKVKFKRFRGLKVVHLDLKGAPPKISYFSRIIPLIASFGANGLLVEYEDMFPYSGNISHISALNAYSLEDINQLNNLAKENNLTVIPLIQTFGHMEFVLKLKEYIDLREAPVPQAICPTNNKSLPLIFEMIDQILNAHKSSRFIHIGCDEVYYVGTCDKCVQRMQKRDWTKFQLSINHIKAVAQHVRKKRRKIEVLIWDDLLREADEVDLIDSKISKFVVPVVWKYVPDVYESLGPRLFHKYSKVFRKIWVASAFKGATGSDQILVDPLYHVENHKSWMRIIADFEKDVKFEGVFLTGWQRYDHFAVLCELLPVAVPSLAFCLQVLQGYNGPLSSQAEETANALQCEKLYGLLGPSFGNPQCQYAGSELLDDVYNLKRLKDQYANLLQDSRVRGWMNDFNVKYNFSNVQLVSSATKTLGEMKMELAQIENAVVRAMEDVYDKYTVEEWRETHIRGFEKDIVVLWEKKERLMSGYVYERRPINVNAEKSSLL